MSKDEAFEIVERNYSGYKVHSYEYINGYYVCKLVPKNWDGSSHNIPVDMPAAVVSSKDKKLVPMDISEVLSILEGVKKDD